MFLFYSFFCFVREGGNLLRIKPLTLECFRSIYLLKELKTVIINSIARNEGPISASMFPVTFRFVGCVHLLLFVFPCFSLSRFTTVNLF
uniref:Uncharacterized protein n=1 Tax=Anguilla anguilla TaxID=7936 RepID=A0A0E9WMR4_ANGAN